MNKEDKLLDRYGRENPFRVPEGYFDNLPHRVMNRVSQRRKRRTAWRWAVAAILAGCVCTATLTIYRSSTVTPQVAESTEFFSDEELDYSLITNQDITDYLTTAE